jgi:hypothetical protein
MYTLDLECEDASHKADNSSSRPTYTSSGGCKFNETGLTGNDTIGDGAKYYQNGAIKKYNAMYIGYHNAGLADYYLSTNCPKSENTTFFAAFSQSKVSCFYSLLSIPVSNRYYGDFSTIRSGCWFCRTCQQQLMFWCRTDPKTLLEMSQLSFANHVIGDKRSLPPSTYLQRHLWQ